MPATPRRAVIIGASLSGLLAARVLSERFDEVVVLERDELPDAPVGRKGTPHSVHPHLLLGRGLEVLEQLFPGFAQALVARGAIQTDANADTAFYFGPGYTMASERCGVAQLLVSRPTLEAEVRQRVRSIANVTVRPGVDVKHPTLDQARGRVTGVRLEGPDGVTSELTAELTVDCCGRGSRTPAWLGAQGYLSPVEEQVGVDVSYNTQSFKRVGEFERGRAIAPAMVIVSVTNEQPRFAALVAQEPVDGSGPRWVLCVGGYEGDHPEPTLDGLRAHIVPMGSPELVKVASEAEPVGGVLRYRFAASTRFRYERLTRFPEGFLVAGDALASFNPVYGQGMTVACCQLLELGLAVDGGLEGVARRFFRAAAKVIENPWQLAVGGDLALERVRGPRPFSVRLINSYIARLRHAARRDAQVTNAFLRVVHMVDPPPRLFAPGVFWRVMTKGSPRVVPTLQA